MAGPPGPPRPFGGVVCIVLTLLGVACPRGALSPARESPSVSLPGASSPSPSPYLKEIPVLRPPIVWKPIPFPASRKREMRAYAGKHYGLATFRLVRPRVIVEHVTAGPTFGPVFDTFARDAPHLGELPGTCAHFVVDTDGTIYQLVSLTLMCRHTVGLNYTAIGIEMVGRSDREVLGNPRQLSAAVRLTLWLMQRFGIRLRDVIGHNESLTSPFHRELVPGLRCQTHRDWNRADMAMFRRRLVGEASRFGISVSPPAASARGRC